jgi:hypothetical protein
VTKGRTLVKALARAWRWQGMLEEGRYASLRELAEAERVSLSYISRILRLTLLAPDIVERILDGRAAPHLAELIQPFPVALERQRTQFVEAPMRADHGARDCLRATSGQSSGRLTPQRGAMES